tara:strand:+ start:176 stop:868 length:693 start_codon:yes stop_codon:yes gene_type:complete
LAKELTHRSGELKSLGWSQDDLSRYEELWEYRQRWGAINLEREDRHFLRKAESALPEISKSKNTLKKALNEKSYYRWLDFYLSAMITLEENNAKDDGSKGAWRVLLEEEIRLLEYYEPVLGLPDSLKAKLLIPLREELVVKSIEDFNGNDEILKFDFDKVLSQALEDNKSWKSLRNEDNLKDQNYPILDKSNLLDFQNIVRKRLDSFMRDKLPSLSETEKPSPADDWRKN